MVWQIRQIQFFQKNQEFFEVLTKMDKNKCPKNKKPGPTFEKNSKIRIWRKFATRFARGKHLLTYTLLLFFVTIYGVVKIS
jgi:hypothetical protein